MNYYLYLFISIYVLLMSGGGGDGCNCTNELNNLQNGRKNAVHVYLYNNRHPGDTIYIYKSIYCVEGSKFLLDSSHNLLLPLVNQSKTSTFILTSNSTSDTLQFSNYNSRPHYINDCGFTFVCDSPSILKNTMGAIVSARYDSTSRELALTIQQKK